MKLRVREVELRRRFAPYRMPFHVAGISITGGMQVYARLRAEDEAGRSAWGVAAETPAPIWFDKSRDLALVEADINESLYRTAGLYLDERVPRSAFDLFALAYPAQLAWSRQRKVPETIGSFGPALLDRAVLDAACRLAGLSFNAAMLANLPGMDMRLCPDLEGFNLGRFLRSRTPRTSLNLRHTIGGVDPLEAGDQKERIGDGLPETLREVIAAYGNRSFKIKIGPDRRATLDRLAAIAAVLDNMLPDYAVTLDGNEAFADMGALAELLRSGAADPRLARFWPRVLYVEQPIHRDVWRSLPAGETRGLVPLIIDESDGSLEDFTHALALGYGGGSVKSCKGLYKAMLNAARCEMRGGGAFLSAEDLNNQNGVSLQQDMAVAGFLGLDRVEKNGHHYMNGMAGAPQAEQRALAEAHPDLYTRDGGVTRLRISGGVANIGSLNAPGFAQSTEPDWSATETLPR